MEAPPPNTARKWVGQNVRSHRERLGLNITQLAERVSACGIPVERSQVSKIESGQTNVDVEKLLALAAALDVIPDRLLRDPEQLDAYEFDRLYRYWFESLREWHRLKAVADLLMEDLIAVGSRLPDGHPVLTEMQSTMMNVITQKGWVLSTERITPDAPGYDVFIEGLIAGRAFEWSEEPNPIPKSADRPAKNKKNEMRGGK
jgi:transcriptional regulator with XRE-family HTH domain